MRKTLSILLFLAMICCAFVSVAENEFVGDWYVKSAGDDEGMYEISSMGLSGFLKINEDNTAVFHFMDELKKGTWKMNGDKIVVSIDGDDAEGNITEEGLRLASSSSSTVLIFTREKPDGIVLAEVNTDAKEEDFNGTWKCVYTSIGDVLVDTSVLESSETPEMIADNGRFVLNNASIASNGGVEPEQMKFSNGKYSDSTTLGELVISYKVELLQDGMLAYTMDLGGEVMSLYFVKEDGTPAVDTSAIGG